MCGRGFLLLLEVEELQDPTQRIILLFPNVFVVFVCLFVYGKMRIVKPPEN